MNRPNAFTCNAHRVYVVGDSKFRGRLLMASGDAFAIVARCFFFFLNVFAAVWTNFSVVVFMHALYIKCLAAHSRNGVVGWQSGFWVHHSGNVIYFQMNKLYTMMKFR